MSRWWRDLSLIRKLYIVVALMATLIISELFTLLFAMNTLSAVRAFVGAEGLWAKAQKNAVLSLFQYALNGDEKEYANFEKQLEVTRGDHIARIELAKENFNFSVTRDGFIKGANDPNDVDGMIHFFRRFFHNSYLEDAMRAWTRADELLVELRAIALELHQTIQTEGKSSPRVQQALRRLFSINQNLTEQENAFSAALGAGSRWLELLLLSVLACAVLAIESTGIFLTYRLSRRLSKSLKELVRTAGEVGKGDLSLSIPVHSKDELGQMAEALNRMVQELKISLSRNHQAEEKLREINAQLRIQKILQSSEAKLNQVIEATPSGLLMVDPTGRIVLCNREIESLFGYNRSELLGKKIEDLIPDRHRSKHPDLRTKYFEKLETRQMIAGRDLTGRRKDGSEVPIEVGLNPVHTEEGQFALASIINVSAQRKAATDLAEAKEAAESANLAKSAFLANMSHEIRTPLGAVLGYAELVVNPEIRQSEKASYIAALKRNGELLSNIINEILDLSKIEAGKMQIATQEVALNDALNDTQILLSLQAKDKGIYLNFVVDENVPSIITTDSLRLRQILINIVGNAVKFTSRGSVDVAVHYQLPESSSVNGGHDQLIFEVKDSGPGLRPDQIEKLFTPFSQADGTSKRRFGGTGLGLVLSKRFANLLGGDVVLTETAPEKGSTFTITINPGATRSSQGKGSTQTKFSETAQFEYSRRPLNGITVLLVDDLPDNQVLIHRLLKLAGAIVEVAGNGQEGIRLANSGQFDIVLMDLQMPIMDGYEATAELRKDGYSGVIVALTAHAMSDVRELCLKSGFNDHISKPVNSEELIARIKSLAPQKQRP